jgi:hypothetical protein
LIARALTQHLIKAFGVWLVLVGEQRKLDKLASFAAHRSNQRVVGVMR